MIVRLQLLLGTVALAGLLPGFGALTPSALEHEIQQHMNEGAGAYVTDVSCSRKNQKGGRVGYTCALHGVDAPPLRVRVDVDGREWRAVWVPPAG